MAQPSGTSPWPPTNHLRARRGMNAPFDPQEGWPFRPTPLSHPTSRGPHFPCAMRPVALMCISRADSQVPYPDAAICVKVQAKCVRLSLCGRYREKRRKSDADQGSNACAGSVKATTAIRVRTAIPRSGAEPIQFARQMPEMRAFIAQPITRWTVPRSAAIFPSAERMTG